MKKVVAHVKNIYLSLSETFIYNYITNIQRYKPIFLTKKTMNLDLFPFQSLYCAPQQKRNIWQCIWEGICKKKFGRTLFTRELYYEDILQRVQAKLIHAHFGPEGVAMLGVKKRLKLPLITTFYGFDMSLLAKGIIWRILYKKLFGEGDLFLVEGNHMKKGLISLGCPPQKIRIQHIGVNVNKFKYRERKIIDDKGKIRVLFCGRLIEKKGILYALKAIKIVIDKFPNLEFRVIGDGELKSEVSQFINGKNLERSVVLLGYQPHSVFLEEIQKAHILLQPSVTAQNGDSEGGAPTALLEAQASGLPVISTYHADIPEVVIDNKSGFLVPERSSKTIAEKLEYLISHPELWGEMGKYGRKHMEKNYNICSEVKKLEDIYSQLIGYS